MKREEGLEHIWSSTHENYRGYAGTGWRTELQSRRTVLVFCGGLGTVLKLLDDLTDEEIAAQAAGAAAPPSTPRGLSGGHRHARHLRATPRPCLARKHRRDPAMKERKRFYREMLGCHERHQELVLTLRL